MAIFCKLLNGARISLLGMNPIEKIILPRHSNVIIISRRYSQSLVKHNTPPNKGLLQKHVRGGGRENNSNGNNNNGRKSSSSSGPQGNVNSNSNAAEANAVAEAVEPPTARQLMVHALRSSIPMIGFGFMDNTIMIHAGHYVDCTLGVTFGLSTLAAAGIGQIFSGIGGVVFGDALEVAFHRMAGINTPTTTNGGGSGVNTVGNAIMTKAQKSLRVSRMAGLLGGILGVSLGCTLGLLNLLFVDENKASLLKLQALEEGQEFEFEVEVDNTANPGYTTVIVRGPDVDGVLASITASIASCGCSVVELHAGLRRKDTLTIGEENMVATATTTTGGSVEVEEGASSGDTSLADSTSPPSALFLESLQSQSSPERVEDTFIIRDRTTHQAIDNDDLDDLARNILAAAKDPLNSHSLKSQLEELEIENMALADRVLVLERILEDQQIRVVPALVETGENKSE